MTEYNCGVICTTEQCQQGRSDRVAYRWIAPDMARTDYTFADLDRGSNQVASALADLGITPGTVVASFLPKTPELFFSILGILKHQAVVCPLFSNFGKTAIYDRLLNANAQVLITKSGLYQRIAETCDALPDLQTVVLIDIPEHRDERVLSYAQLVEQAAATYAPQPTPPDTLSLLHYTSGSTGKPKGAQHVHGNLSHLRMTAHEVFQFEPEDVYWCTADQAWVTGVSYGVLTPWAEGITQVHYGGTFNPANWFRVLEEQSVTIWYTAPTALRMIMQQIDSIDRDYDFSALKRVYSVGEPLNPEIIHWAREFFGCEIYDTWFQTETGGIMIANRPGLPVRVGSMGKPVGPVQAGVRSDDYQQAAPPQTPGKLCLRSGWESMFVAYRHMPDTYAAKFYDGWYDTGDLARLDEDGYFWFMGRGDDVINTSGHLVGPFEVESALLEVPEIVDVAIIGAPDELLHEKIVAFVTLKSGVSWSRKLELACRIHVSNRVSPLAVPVEYVVTESIPKNRSGKIMRRVLKAQYLGEDAGDTSTMEKPE